METLQGMDRRRLLALGTGLATVWPSLALAQTTSRFTPTQAPYVTVETAHGVLRGGHSRGAIAFKGVAYAGSPAGTGRFKAPPPLQSWTGVRDALKIGAPSIQAPGGYYGEQEPSPSEDCLTLNIWTPAVGDGKRRPVMVYSHGGGFRGGSGGSPTQDGARLAAEYDVVVVATNHRLGLMGYLYLGELAGQAYASSGNQGMLDIVAAHAWVRDNIAAFGGDPNNVLAFGESGGGQKTATLMAMPAARGLFHKASIQSGPFLRALPRDRATETARQVLKALDIAPSQAHRLAEVPVAALLALQLGDKAAGRPPIGDFAPVVDGTYLPRHPFDPGPAAFSADIPLIIGTNQDEATFFLMDEPAVFRMDDAALTARVRSELGSRADAVLAAFRASRPTATPPELFVAIRTAGMERDSILSAEHKVGQGGAPVYMYRYAYRSDRPITGTDWTLRAGHATEIGILFDNVDVPGLQGSKPDRVEVARHMSEMWTTFARTGHPGAKGQPTWPAYEPDRRATMIIDTSCSVQDDPRPLERAAFAP
jgi:para-nitrobenzyl esterase